MQKQEYWDSRFAQED
jgi:SAM-dependent methyltransferase